MTPRERLLATLRREPLDRPPLAFWRHAPGLDRDPRRLADATLRFADRWRLDLIKLTPSATYCVEDWGCRPGESAEPTGAAVCASHAIRSEADWTRIAPLDPGAGALGRELEAVHRVARLRAEEIPVVHTLFSPLSVALKLAGDRLREDLRRTPEPVRRALEAITATLIRYARTALEAGADGIFVATQAASRRVVDATELGDWELPYLRRLLDSLEPLSSVTILHLHGQELHFERFTDLPAHVLSWADRQAGPSLSEARRGWTAVVMGGLDEWGALRTGPRAAIEAEVHDALRQTDGLGLVLAPGCVLPLDLPDEHLAAVVRAARGSATRTTR
jgi:uroporphyrinogen decarboxylase